MKFREMEKILLKDGWYLVNVKGSHYQYKHNNKSGKVTVPNHKKDLSITTVKNIFRQAVL